MLLRSLLIALLLLLRAHVLHVLADLRLLVGGQNGEDLIAQLPRGTVDALRTGRVRLNVLIEQTLNLIVLLVRKVHTVEYARPAPIDLRRCLRPGGTLLLHDRRRGRLLRADGDGK